MPTRQTVILPTTGGKSVEIDPAKVESIGYGNLQDKRTACTVYTTDGDKYRIPQPKRDVKALIHKPHSAENKL